MLAPTVDEQGEVREADKTLIVKRVNLIFNDKECQVLNFTDVTTTKRLNEEQEKSKQLTDLSTTVHHELLGPLKSNVDFAEYLVKHLKDSRMRKKAKLILISSKMIIFHANDMLDLRFLQTGNFTPSLSLGSASDAITEIVSLVESTICDKDIAI